MIYPMARMQDIEKQLHYLQKFLIIKFHKAENTIKIKTQQQIKQS